MKGQLGIHKFFLNFSLFSVNKLSVTSLEQVKSFANCSESANDDGYKHNFYTVPQTLHLSFQKSWYNMHALIIIIIFIIVIIIINIIISNITLLFVVVVVVVY